MPVSELTPHGCRDCTGRGAANPPAKTAVAASPKSTPARKQRKRRAGGKRAAAQGRALKRAAAALEGRNYAGANHGKCFDCKAQLEPKYWRRVDVRCAECAEKANVERDPEAPPEFRATFVRGGLPGTNRRRR